MSERGFPVGEYRDRVARTQTAMTKAGLGALLLTTDVELRYYTGFLTRFWESPTRPWFLILPFEGDPVAVIPSIGVPLMSRSWLTDIRHWQSPDYDDDGIGLLSDTLSELCPRQARIGLPDGPETHLRMPFRDLERLRRMLGPDRVRGDDGLTRSIRSIKSEPEIAKIRTACSIAGRAFARVPEILQTGTPLSNCFRGFQRLCLEEGADWVPYLAGGAGPDGYEDVISPADERPLAQGDVLMLDTGLMYDGYFCDYDRNWSLGPPSSDVQTAHNRLVKAVDAAVELCRPGRTAAELFHAMDKVLTNGTSGPKPGRFGHGLGMHLTEGLSLIPSDHSVLQPGMVLTLEPGVEVGPGRILVHEENIVIRDGPAEFLSPRARDIGVI
jgi:Xaa-Pro aminopeptidase